MARVLLIDDDPLQLELRRLILEQAGHQVETAETAQEAIERSPGCDVAVLDLIPRHSELSAALPGGTRVIVLSGRDPDPGLRVDQVLKKPCPSKRLLAAIESYGLPR
jgi:DNA-binding response OmpR family regulator